MIRDIEELRGIAISMSKPLEQLLYEMLVDSMVKIEELKSQRTKYRRIINDTKVALNQFDPWLEPHDYQRLKHIQDILHERNK